MDKRVIQLIGVGLVCVLAKLTVYVSEETCPETYITTSCDVTVPSGTCHHIQLEVPGVCERVILRTAARGVDCGAWGVNEELDSPLMDSDCECSSRTCVCLLVANELAADRNISVECREKLWDEENLFVVTIYTGESLPLQPTITVDFPTANSDGTAQSTVFSSKLKASSQMEPSLIEISPTLTPSSTKSAVTPPEVPLPSSTLPPQMFTSPTAEPKKPVAWLKYLYWTLAVFLFLVIAVWYCLWKHKINCTRIRKKDEENLEGDDRRDPHDDRRDPGEDTVEMTPLENGYGERHAYQRRNGNGGQQQGGACSDQQQNHEHVYRSLTKPRLTVLDLDAHLDFTLRYNYNSTECTMESTFSSLHKIHTIVDQSFRDYLEGFPLPKNSLLVPPTGQLSSVAVATELLSSVAVAKEVTELLSSVAVAEEVTELLSSVAVAEECEEEEEEEQQHTTSQEEEHSEPQDSIVNNENEENEVDMQEETTMVVSKRCALHRPHGLPKTSKFRNFDRKIPNVRVVALNSSWQLFNMNEELLPKELVAMTSLSDASAPVG